MRASRSFGEADRTTVRDDRAVYRGWFLRAIRGLYGSFTNGGLAFLQNIHPENILSLSLSLDPRRTWFDALDEEC